LAILGQLRLALRALGQRVVDGVGRGLVGVDHQLAHALARRPGLRDPGLHLVGAARRGRPSAAGLAHGLPLEAAEHLQRAAPAVGPQQHLVALGAVDLVLRLALA
jgi:hypothetical protein